MVTNMAVQNLTMINALHLNCKVLALDTVFNVEMLQKKNQFFSIKIKTQLAKK